MKGTNDEPADSVETEIGRLNRNLELLIGLLTEFPRPVQPATLGERITRLNDLGMEPADIARVLNRDRVRVNQRLYQNRQAAAVAGNLADPK